MSINSILSNSLILGELATTLSPFFPDTGITSLVGDSNITCNVSGKNGTVHLNGDITVANLTVTSTETVNGIVNIKSALQLNGSAGTSGQVLTSAGAGTLPTWTTNNSTTSFLNNYTGQHTNTTGTTITLFNQTLTGLTIGKKLIGNVTATSFLNPADGADATYELILTVNVDGTPIQTLTTGIFRYQSSGSNIYCVLPYSISFNHVNTATSHAITMTLAGSGSLGTDTLATGTFTGFTSSFYQQ